MTDVTPADKLACAEREVKYRRRVYSRLVEEGRMKADQAERQIAIMEAIAADYRAIAERDAGPLFGRAS